jgi:MOSC domain-containing protein YiiM
VSPPEPQVPVDAEAAPSGRLRAIWLKRFKRGPMDPHPRASLVAGRGLAGNANQGGRRQVTLLAEEGWADALADLGFDPGVDPGAGLDPSLRRANLLISGIRLEKTRGRILRIGSCRLRVFSETTPCHQMDETWPGLQRALRPAWRGGVCAQVLEGGEIEVGDEVRWEEPEEAPQASLPFG